MDSRDASIEQPLKDFGDVRNRSLRIRLPHQAPLNRLALDIGGSLAKVVYFKDGSLHFASVETEHLDSLLTFLQPLARDLGAAGPPLTVHATGGGAYRESDKLSDALATRVDKTDEIESLIRGATFFLSQIPNEVFSWNPELPDPMVVADPLLDEPLYPYMLVNIGSGVGFIKVEGPNSFERVGGTALGGGTLWGLLAMLTPAKNFDEMLQMAARGDNHNVDMLVGDIYGGGYPRMGLTASTTASFFAKAFKDRDEEFDPADISRSLLVAISYNIAQLAYLHARFHSIEHIYFAGSYIRGHAQTIETLANGIRYWSKGDKTAYFFRHEGYLGAMGAFL